MKYLSVPDVAIIITIMSWLHIAINYATARDGVSSLTIFGWHTFVTAATILWIKVLECPEKSESSSGKKLTVRQSGGSFYLDTSKSLDKKKVCGILD